MLTVRRVLEISIDPDDPVNGWGKYMIHILFYNSQEDFITETEDNPKNIGFIGIKNDDFPDPIPENISMFSATSNLDVFGLVLSTGIGGCCTKFYFVEFQTGYFHGVTPFPNINVYKSE